MKRVRCSLYWEKPPCDGWAERTGRRTQDGGTVFVCPKCGAERILYEDFLVDIFSIPVEKAKRKKKA
jgi:hypothetical protein